jgi:hypothetical protein
MGAAAAAVLSLQSVRFFVRFMCTFVAFAPTCVAGVRTFVSIIHTIVSITRTIFFRHSYRCFHYSYPCHRYARPYVSAVFAQAGAIAVTSDHNLIRVDVGDAALVRESRGALPSRRRARARLFIGAAGRCIYL